MIIQIAFLVAVAYLIYKKVHGKSKLVSESDNILIYLKTLGDIFPYFAVFKVSTEYKTYYFRNYKNGEWELIDDPEIMESDLEIYYDHLKAIDPDYNGYIFNLYVMKDCKQDPKLNSNIKNYPVD